MLFSYLSLALLAQLALAAPSTSPLEKKPSPECKKVKRKVTFDDIKKTVPATVLNPIPDSYHGLSYSGITFADVVTSGLLPNVAPKSGKSFAVANVLSTTAQGITPMITSNFEGSEVDNFTPRFFSYACMIALGQGAVNPPTQCDVHVTGYSGRTNVIDNAKQECSQTFTYRPGELLGTQQMALGKFHQCRNKKIDFMTISYSLPGELGAAETVLGVAIDSFRYDAFTCSKNAHVD